MMLSFTNRYHLLQGSLSMGTCPLSGSDLETVSQAAYIAMDSLRSRYSENGILAGSTHFADIWARDCCLAAYGALSLEDHEIVRRSIKVLLNNMNSEGQVPLRVGQKYFLLRFLHLHHIVPIKEGPVFMEDKYISIPKDSNSLALILLANYMKQSQDDVFLDEYFDQAVKVFEWNILQLSSRYLIQEGHYAGWADSLRKEGSVLYTNVLGYQACQSMSYLAQIHGRSDIQKLAMDFADKMKASIQSVFWNGSYFLDWVCDAKEPLTHMALDGNLFAILFGITDEVQTESIIRKMESLGAYQDVCVGVHYPDIHSRHAYPAFRWIGLADYHTQLKWLWLSCVDVVAQLLAGHRDRAYHRLLGIADKICEYQAVYEVYEPGGKPVNRLFYKSEKTFAWSSGMFVWAVKQCGLLNIR